MSATEISSIYNPEGVVESRIYRSSVAGPSERRMIVYLPEDYYDGEGKSYPVVYLIHGARGNESSWIKDGDVFRITDSLVAVGEMVPSIIVMPNMNQYNDDVDAYQSRFKRPVESFFESDGVVESGFVKDVVHFVDSLYRSVPDKKHRALAGLSIGAFQSIHISAAAPDIFGYIGLFSPMVKAPIRHSDYSSFYKGLKIKQKEQFSDPPELYFIGIGKTDFFYPHIKHYRRYLTKNGYPFQYMESGGGHNWTNWKKFFTRFIELSFKEL